MKILWVNNQNKTWVAKSGSGGAVSRVARVGGNRRILANDVDISKDFVSFWFKAHGTITKFIYLMIDQMVFLEFSIRIKLSCDVSNKIIYI